MDTRVHEPLHSAWWNFARTCTSKTSRILLNFKVKGQCHFSLVDQSSPNCFYRTWKKIVHDNAVFRFAIAWSVPEIFAIEVNSYQKYSTLLITQEPLHLAWCNFACTSTSTISSTLLNFKVIGQRSRSYGFLVFFSVRDAAATRGQYLALTKAW